MKISAMNLMIFKHIFPRIAKCSMNVKDSTNLDKKNSQMNQAFVKKKNYKLCASIINFQFHCNDFPVNIENE